MMDPSSSFVASLCKFVHTIFFFFFFFATVFVYHIHSACVCPNWAVYYTRRKIVSGGKNRTLFFSFFFYHWGRNAVDTLDAKPPIHASKEGVGLEHQKMYDFWIFWDRLFAGTKSSMCLKSCASVVMARSLYKGTIPCYRHKDLVDGTPVSSKSPLNKKGQTWVIWPPMISQTCCFLPLMGRFF